MSYKFNSIINKNEADALKEMIFKRARERAQTLNEDVQADVMDLARDSFVSDNNPFSRIVNNSENQDVNPQDSKPIPPEKQENKNNEFQHKKEVILKQNKINEQISTAAIQNNMIEARNALSNKTSFMGALNFLNSQAAISLIKTRSDKFEMIV